MCERERREGEGKREDGWRERDRGGVDEGNSGAYAGEDALGILPRYGCCRTGCALRFPERGSLDMYVQMLVSQSAHMAQMHAARHTRTRLSAKVCQSCIFATCDVSICISS